MFIYILSWIYGGQQVHTAFTRGYHRRRYGRRMLLVPEVECGMEDMTAEEIGQLLGGN